jgi:hypothetical protein
MLYSIDKNYHKTNFYFDELQPDLFWLASLMMRISKSSNAQ